MIDLNFLHNAVDEGDFTEDVCRGLLDALAEVEQLRQEVVNSRDLVGFLRRQADVHCARITELDEENQRLREALPDAELLERAAVFAAAYSEWEFMRWFQDAAARIREVQNAKAW